MFEEFDKWTTELGKRKEHIRVMVSYEFFKELAEHDWNFYSVFPDSRSDVIYANEVEVYPHPSDEGYQTRVLIMNDGITHDRDASLNFAHIKARQTPEWGTW
jgi:hypothetical protein